MRNYGYGSYRGRSRTRKILKGIIAVLVVVLLLLVAAFFLLQRYMVISPEGVRFELPFLQGGDGAEGGPAAADTPPPVVVTPSPTPTPTPTPAREALHAVELPRQALYDGTAAQQTADAGGNAALFDMKGDDGSLGYVSDLKLARDIRVSASDPELNAAIRTLNGGELYTIARVSCFRDNTLPYYRNNMALRSKGGNWRDRGQSRWASPADEDVVDYLASVCAELAELGFNEILLDWAAYPTDGNLKNIVVGADYTPGSLAEPVEAFYERVADALAPYDVKLSIVSTPAAVLEGSDGESGQSAAVLARYAQRVWLVPGETAAEDYIAALETAGLADAAENCVLMGSTAGSEEEIWGLLAEE